MAHGRNSAKNYSSSGKNQVKSSQVPRLKVLEDNDIPGRRGEGGIQLVLAAKTGETIAKCACWRREEKREREKRGMEGKVSTTAWVCVSTVWCSSGSCESGKVAHSTVHHISFCFVKRREFICMGKCGVRFYPLQYWDVFSYLLYLLFEDFIQLQKLMLVL